MNMTLSDQDNQALSQNNEVAFLPLSLLSTSRREFYDGQHRKPDERSLQLTVKAGLSEELTELPADLTGSMFVVAPAGVVNSPKVEGTDTILPTKDGWTHLLNGDGMIYRIDFGKPKPKFSCRLMSNASFYADKITHDKYPLLKFVNFGIARLSTYIGTSNQANTAFLKIRKPNQASRLLVTSDVERPIEIDPVSLRLIAPIGSNRDWDSPFKIASVNKPIKSTLTTSHLVHEPNSYNIITVNVVKSLWQTLSTSLLKILDISVYNNKHSTRLWKTFVRILSYSLTISSPFISWVLKILDIDESGDLYLLRWDSENDALEKWKVKLADGSSISIEQTVHQMGITEDFIIFADTAFKVAFSSTLPGPEISSGMEESQQKLFSWLRSNRKKLNFPLRENTMLYIISRKQLNKIKSGGTLIAKQICLTDAAIVHYQVDYQNPDGKIYVHAALNQSTDFSEFVHAEDSIVCQNIETLHRKSMMAGMFSGAMEINRPKTYIIDADFGQVQSESTISFDEACQHTCSLGVAAFRDDNPTTSYTDIYWSSVGAWPETVLESLANLYKEPTTKETKELQKIFTQRESGVPTSICRIHIEKSEEKPTISVADSFQFPVREKIAYYGNSPQFIPRPGSAQSTDGYIVCTVNYSDNACSTSTRSEKYNHSWSANSEIWIFDARNLGQGPLYRLSHAQLNFGITLHTTWLEKIASPANPRKYDVRKDFEHLVHSSAEYHSKKSPDIERQIRKLFQEIYSEIEREQNE